VIVKPLMKKDIQRMLEKYIPGFEIIVKRKEIPAKKTAVQRRGSWHDGSNPSKARRKKKKKKSSRSKHKRRKDGGVWSLSQGPFMIIIFAVVFINFVMLYWISRRS